MYSPFLTAPQSPITYGGPNGRGEEERERERKRESERARLNVNLRSCSVFVSCRFGPRYRGHSGYATGHGDAEKATSFKILE